MKNQNLVAARQYLGKTQKQVADEVKLNIRMYQRYETPTGNSIARALGTTSEALFGFRLTNVV